MGGRTRQPVWARTERRHGILRQHHLHHYLYPPHHLYDNVLTALQSRAHYAFPAAVLRRAVGS
jgi:hypothetical protein